MAWLLRNQLNKVQFTDFGDFAGLKQLLPGETGFITVPFASLTIDIDGIPTTYEDIPDDYAIGVINAGNNPLQPSYTVPLGTFISFPVLNLPFINYTISWTLQPLGLSNSTPQFAASPAYPPYPTKWNGLLQAFMQQMSLRMIITNIGSSNLNLNVNEDAGTASMAGSDLSIPPPPYIEYYPYFNHIVDFEGRAQLLLDASGIYTLTPGKKNDTLIQRSGSTSTTTNVAIPNPFGETAFLGD